MEEYDPKPKDIERDGDDELVESFFLDEWIILWNLLFFYELYPPNQKMNFEINYTMNYGC